MTNLIESPGKRFIGSGIGLPGESGFVPTPTESGIPLRSGDFSLLTEALDYAAMGKSGCNFYSARGELDASLEYTQLRDRARAWAGRILGYGLNSGDRVAMIAETGPDFITGFLACVYAKVLPVPLPGPAAFSERGEYTKRVAHQAARCGAKFLFAPPDSWVNEDLKDCPSRILRWDELGEGNDTVPELSSPEPDDICYLQYSSGSTRFPTGVAVTHRALMNNCRDIALHGLSVKPEDRVASWLPLYHDMGLVGTFLTALANQRSADYLASGDFARRPALWLQIIARNKATVSYSPCFGYDLCRRRVNAAQASELDLSSWRVAGVGGEMISPGVMQEFAAAFHVAGFRRDAFLASYGLAEATLGVTFAPLGQGLLTDTVDRRRLAAEKRAVPSNGAESQTFVRCGRPLPSHQVEIRDEANRPLPSRRVGRIFVRGESVMKGYFDDERATALVLDGEGWLDTGDMGYIADESLILVGRSKDIIIINGRNIWPQDLEWAVEQLPGVRSQDCAAFSVTDSNKGEAAVVLIQCRSRDLNARASLVETARRALRRASGIECLVILVPPRSLPRTSSGKLNRGLAREKYLSGKFNMPD